MCNLVYIMLSFQEWLQHRSAESFCTSARVLWHDPSTGPQVRELLWWIGIKHNVQVDMCIQRRFKSVYASAQSEQSLSFPYEENLEPWFIIWWTYHNCLKNVWVYALLPCQKFFSHVWMFSWVEPVLSNDDKVSCIKTRHNTALWVDLNLWPLYHKSGTPL